jgi:hypothetical protein
MGRGETAMPRVRFSVQGLMLTVAVVGLALAGSMFAMRMTRTAARYRDRERLNGVMVKAVTSHIAFCQKNAESYERLLRDRERLHPNEPAPRTFASLKEAVDSLESEAPDPGYFAKVQASRSEDAMRSQVRWWRANEADAVGRLAHFEAMRRKHAQAARSPWIDVPPDPPIPYKPGFEPP